MRSVAVLQERIIADRNRVRDIGSEMKLARMASSATLNGQAPAVPSQPRNPQTPSAGSGPRQSPRGSTSRSEMDTMKRRLNEMEAKYRELAGAYAEAAKTASRAHRYWRQEGSHHYRTVQERGEVEVKLVESRAKVLQLEERLRSAEASRPGSCTTCSRQDRRVSSLEDRLACKNEELTNAKERIKTLEQALAAVNARVPGPQSSAPQGTFGNAHARPSAYQPIDSWARSVTGARNSYHDPGAPVDVEMGW
ncbi:hypothetical protein NMY22_g13758 [Coprinellus aureogranulatus]|nr:hypothetical protein NMY22_g13758 [Coprinellus aureogranulatus]